MRYRLLILAVVGLVVMAAGLVWAVLPGFEVENRLDAERPLRIDLLAGNALLWRQGYWQLGQRVRVVFTLEPQNMLGLQDKEGELLLSLRRELTGRQMTLFIHMRPDRFDQAEEVPGGLDEVVFAGLCWAFKTPDVGWPECMEEASEQVKWSEQVGLPGLIKQGRWWSFVPLVKQAYAQYCSGTIFCGQDLYTCTCQGGTNAGVECYSDGQCNSRICGGCQMECRDVGNNLSCSSLASDQALCNSTTNASCSTRCALQSTEYPCSWSSQNPPPGGAGGGGTPACSYKTLVDPDLDCTQTGLWGRAYPFGNLDYPTWEGYTCGPRAVDGAA